MSMFILFNIRRNAILLENAIILIIIYVFFLYLMSIRTEQKQKIGHNWLILLFGWSFLGGMVLTFVRIIIENWGIITNIFITSALQFTLLWIFFTFRYKTLSKKGIITNKSDKTKKYPWILKNSTIIGTFLWCAVVIKYLVDQKEVNITAAVKQQFVWAIGIVLISNGFVRLINFFRSEKKKELKIIIRSAIFATDVVILGVWFLLTSIFGMLIKETVSFKLHFHGIIFIIYIPVYILFLRRNQKEIHKSPSVLGLTGINLENIEKASLKPTEIVSDSPLNDHKTSEKKIQEKHTEPRKDQDLRQKILQVKNLKTYFYTDEGVVKAVEGITFEIYDNEILGLVGETGCGKSVTALSILQMVRPPGKIIDGKVIFKGEDLLQKDQAEIQKFRGDNITMMFQDPLNSINPVFRAGDQITEVYLLHKKKELIQEAMKYQRVGKVLKRNRVNPQNLQKEIAKLNMEDFINQMVKEQISIANPLTELSPEEFTTLIKECEKKGSIFSIARDWSIKLLRAVGIPDPDKIYERYPHELSGGMRQRIMIAMGLACRPKLLIADEPTTALDVTIQAQILDLMKDLQQQFQTSILFITHDLGLISQMCDRVAVMYSGYIVEYGEVLSLFQNPCHPYSKGLITAIPIIGKRKDELTTIPGTVPNLIYPPSGCRFHPRCPYKFEPCANNVPKLNEIKSHYYVACHLYDDNLREKYNISKDLKSINLFEEMSPNNKQRNTFQDK